MCNIFDSEVDRLPTALHSLLGVRSEAEVRTEVGLWLRVVIDVLPVELLDAPRYGGPGSVPEPVSGEAHGR